MADFPYSILLRLRHPNIIRLKEIFEDDVHLSLILEHVTGGELFDRIVQRGSYTERDAALCVQQICSAVAYLHENGVRSCVPLYKHSKINISKNFKITVFPTF